VADQVSCLPYQVALVSLLIVITMLNVKPTVNVMQIKAHSLID